eukprot:TRINITY_DN13227_c0_g1_i4.p2 TRINITY_DN13227_c0_g1~~TRINITY_DN13227_c0_g1_i4.p2  ORF type:complete len:181 (+),score=9.49 TRINITY_DN13227_c0_g1_i4:433-975(+)
MHPWCHAVSISASWQMDKRSVRLASPLYFFSTAQTGTRGFSSSASHRPRQQSQECRSALHLQAPSLGTLLWLGFFPSSCFAVFERRAGAFLRASRCVAETASACRCFAEADDASRCSLKRTVAAASTHNLLAQASTGDEEHISAETEARGFSPVPGSSNLAHPWGNAVPIESIQRLCQTV